jgi:CHASE2 domain-containing sensor protein
MRWSQYFQLFYFTSNIPSMIASRTSPELRIIIAVVIVHYPCITITYIIMPTMYWANVTPINAQVVQFMADITTRVQQLKQK